MLRNYFKIALRNLSKNKVFSFINIGGLTIGLASFLLVSLYIFDELTFDGFHKNANSIYRVVEKKIASDGKETQSATISYLLSQRSKTDIPEVKDFVRILGLGRSNVGTTENANVFYERYWVATPDFLKVFDFDVLYGDRETALKDPHSVVVTKETAEKLFGNADVLGKTINLDGDSIPCKITAVLANFPINSQLSFNLLFPESSLTSERFMKFVNSDWDSNTFTTYLLLNENANPATVQTKISNLVKANSKDENKEKRSFLLQPLKEVHFNSENIEGNLGKTGSIGYIYIFSGVALFVLLIACINYMNLTTARFMHRAKEIAVRKVAGASQQTLAGQFLSEAFLTTLFALFFALIVVKVLLSKFNAFTEKQLTLGTSTDYRVWIGILMVVIVVGLLSGIYPALVQSRLKPLLLLKNKITLGKGNISLRKSLVVFQFTLSIIMIVATLIVYQQMSYMKNKDMGFKKDQLVVIDINSGEVRRGQETIKYEFAKLPQVKEVTLTSRVPGEWKNLPKVKVNKEQSATTKGNDMFFLGVDDQFLKTYKVELVKGRNFTNSNASDSSAVLLNESAAKALGIIAPSEELIEIPSANYGDGFSSLDAPFKARVIGIVKDFNFQSLHEPLAPMVIANINNPIHSSDYFTIRVASGDLTATLKQMDAIMRGIDQTHLLEYHFLDKQWELLYKEDKIRETIFFIIAILTISIACLGLFGLATYAAEQRIKEIGIRKVLGASVQSIVTMLSTDFLKMVLIAAVIAFPIAWYAMHNWLQDFAYRITIQWWMFVIAGLLALLIAVITVSFQAIKAAIANPVKSLKTE